MPSIAERKAALRNFASYIHELADRLDTSIDQEAAAAFESSELAKVLGAITGGILGRILVTMNILNLAAFRKQFMRGVDDVLDGGLHNGD